MIAPYIRPGPHPFCLTLSLQIDALIVAIEAERVTPAQLAVLRRSKSRLEAGVATSYGKGARR